MRRGVVWIDGPSTIRIDRHGTVTLHREPVPLEQAADGSWPLPDLPKRIPITLEIEYAEDE